jgi:hypothetical protein
MKRLVLLLLAAGLASACASAQAKAPADRPALEVPPPPPRTVEPLPAPESPNLEPVGDLPQSSPPPMSKPRPTPARETPRSEPKPPETPPTEPSPPPTTAPIPPAPQLRTPGVADGPEAEKQVRDMIEGAKKALFSVNFQRLNNAQRGQYNDAKLMITKAEEQLKGSNFDIARNLAEKANRIATELQGR